MRKAVIGIQARSDSTRLPGKVRALVAGKPVIEWVIDSCLGVLRYMKKDREAMQVEVSYCLLVPKGDPLATIYQGKHEILEGDKDDVLSRYVELCKLTGADYIVRVTADCVAIPTHIIAKHIKSALIKQRDYTTNCLIRSFREGMDVQVFSKRLLEWVDSNAKDPRDREHVGTLLDRVKFPFKDNEGRPSICHVIAEYYEPDVRTSIDTKEDLQKAIERETLLAEAVKLGRRTGVVVR